MITIASDSSQGESPTHRGETCLVPVLKYLFDDQSDDQSSKIKGETINKRIEKINTTIDKFSKYAVESFIEQFKTMNSPSDDERKLLGCYTEPTNEIPDPKQPDVNVLTWFNSRIKPKNARKDLNTAAENIISRLRCGVYLLRVRNEGLLNVMLMMLG